MCRASDPDGLPCPYVATRSSWKVVVSDDGSECWLYPELCDRHYTRARVEAEVSRLRAATSVKARCKRGRDLFFRVAGDPSQLCPSCTREDLVHDNPDVEPGERR